MELNEAEQKTLLELFKQLLDDYTNTDFDIVGKNEKLISECENFLSK